MTTFGLRTDIPRLWDNMITKISNDTQTRRKKNTGMHTKMMAMLSKNLTGVPQQMREEERDIPRIIDLR